MYASNYNVSEFLIIFTVFRGNFIELIENNSPNQIHF